MTSYRTKEEVEREFDARFRNWREDPDLWRTDMKDTIHSLRLSDLEGIIEAVESMKFEGDLAESSERRHNTAINSVLSYLKSLKQ